MKIPTKVTVTLPDGVTLDGTYTGNGDQLTTLAWVRMVEGDSSSKILVPSSWLAEVKPPLPAEPADSFAVVMVRHDNGAAFPYAYRAGKWINAAGNRSTWAEVCERDKDGAPVQVWPSVEPTPRPTGLIEFRAHHGTHRTTMTWPDQSDTRGELRHVIAMGTDAATDLERLINP